MSGPSKRKTKRKAKRQHRESTLPPGQAARVLDRLLLLEKVIPPGEVRQSSRTPAASTPDAAP